MRPERHDPCETPNADDDERTDEAKRVIKDYAAALREMLEKLRKLFN